MVKQYMDYLSIALVVSLFLPLLSNNIPGIMYLIILWDISFVFVYSEGLFDKNMLRVLLLGLFLFVLYFFVMDMASPKTNDIWYMIQKDYIAMFTAISLYTYYKRNRNGLIKLSKIVIACIIVTSILTISVSLIYPEFSRKILEAEYYADRFTDSQIQNLLFFNRFGAGTRADGFGFMVICILFAFFYKYRNLFCMSKWKIIPFAFACLLALVQMQFATLILYTLFFSVLSFLNIRQMGVAIILLITGLILLMIIPVDNWVLMFNSIADYFGRESSLGVRFHDIADYIQFGGSISDNGISVRIDNRYYSAFKTFFSSPFVGVLCINDTSYGLMGESHLYLMNKLVVTGLVGFVLWINVFWGFYNDFKLRVTKSFSLVFNLVFISILSYGLIKVIIVRQAWILLFVVLPGVNYYIEKRKKSVNSRL